MKLLLLLAAAGLALAAGDREPVPLWPGTPPGDKPGGVGEEQDATKPSDGLVGGRRLIRLGNVSTPALTVYKPPKEKDTGAAVVVFPGGGYRILAYDLEGSEVCEWLNSIGVTGVLVKYRVPRREGRPMWEAPLQDAQRSVSLVRAHAKEWGIDPQKIGVLGFSAGGHLSAVVSNRFAERTYPPIDETDRVDCRPDFTVLVYPAYLNGEKPTESVSPELPVSGRTPPTFIVQTEDDNRFIAGTLIYYRALQAAKVPAELHVFPSGGHGYGLRPGPNAVTHWPELAAAWMRGLGFLGK